MLTAITTCVSSLTFFYYFISNYYHAIVLDKYLHSFLIADKYNTSNEALQQIVSVSGHDGKVYRPTQTIWYGDKVSSKVKTS